MSFKVSPIHIHALACFSISVSGSLCLIFSFFIVVVGLLLKPELRVQARLHQGH